MVTQAEAERGAESQTDTLASSSSFPFHVRIILHMHQMGKNVRRLCSAYLQHEGACAAAGQNMLIYFFPGNYCAEVYFLK